MVDLNYWVFFLFQFYNAMTCSNPQSIFTHTLAPRSDKHNPSQQSRLHFVNVPGTHSSFPSILGETAATKDESLLPQQHSPDSFHAASFLTTDPWKSSKEILAKHLPGPRIYIDQAVHLLYKCGCLYKKTNTIANTVCTHL